MPTKEELLAYNKNIKKCVNILKQKVKFLSLDGLYRALTNEKRNNNYPQFSDHYFTGELPYQAC